MREGKREQEKDKERVELRIWESPSSIRTDSEIKIEKLRKRKEKRNILIVKKLKEKDLKYIDIKYYIQTNSYTNRSTNTQTDK